MPVYVTLYEFMEQGVRNIKGSPKRVEKIKEEFKKAGAQGQGDGRAERPV